jgi:hypothetical protein
VNRFICVTVLLLPWSALAPGCGEDALAAPDGGPASPEGAGDAGPDERARVFVGALSGSDVKLGAIASAKRARLFFCGGPESYEDMTRWLVVEVDPSSAFALDADGWRIDGTLDPQQLRGQLQRDGEDAAEFAAQRVDADTLAGVYEGMDRCGRVGLIVTQPAPDEPATAQGACVAEGHLPEQVNPILPIALDADGAIAVELMGERMASLVAAAAP